MPKLIVGCGYLGSRVAKLWRSAGDDVHVVTRMAQKAAELQQQGLRPIVASIHEVQTLAELPPAETILYSVGFDRALRNTIAQTYRDGLKNVLRSLRDSASRVIYISTTGVYGDAAGDWIDENTPTHPQREGGRASLAAEQALASHPLSKSSVILRLAGLYGPGRIPYLDLLHAGQPIPAPEHGHLNLIHVDDAALVVVAASQLASFTDGPRIYCVSDGHPVQRGDYYHEIARQIGAPPPMFTAPHPNSPRARRAQSDRRVRNDRMLAELKVNLEYLDYRAGLKSILADSSSAT